MGWDNSVSVTKQLVISLFDGISFFVLSNYMYVYMYCGENLTGLCQKRSQCKGWGWQVYVKREAKVKVTIAMGSGLIFANEMYWINHPKGHVVAVSKTRRPRVSNCQFPDTKILKTMIHAPCIKCYACNVGE